MNIGLRKTWGKTVMSRGCGRREERWREGGIDFMLLATLGAVDSLQLHLREPSLKPSPVPAYSGTKPRLGAALSFSLSVIGCPAGLVVRAGDATLTQAVGTKQWHGEGRGKMRFTMELRWSCDGVVPRQKLLGARREPLQFLPNTEACAIKSRVQGQFVTTQLVYPGFTCISMSSAALSMRLS
jgi:hypothetical protein